MRSRVWLIVVPLVIVSVVVTLNLFFYQSYQAETAAQINRQQLIIARTVATSIQDMVEHYAKETTDFAALLAGRGLDLRGLEEFVRHGLTELKEDIHSSASIFDRGGREIYVKNPQNRLKGGVSGGLVARVLALKPGESVIDDAMIGEGIIYIGTPVPGGQSIQGALVVGIMVEDINQKFLEPLKTGHGGYAWMMNADGTVIYHPKESSMVGKNIFLDDEHCYKCHKSFSTEKQILASSDVGFSSYQAPYGEDKLVSFAWIRPLKWVVCVSIPYSVVTASIVNSMRLHSLLVISISVLTVIGASVIVFINRERVKAEARAIYAEKIREYADELEVIVKERTRELRSEKEKLDAVVGSLHAGIAVLDASGTGRWMNAVMREWLAGGAEDGFSLSHIYGGEGTVGDVLASVVRDSFVQDQMQLDLGRRKGHFQVSLTPLKSPEGERQFLLLLQDVTYLKTAEQRLMQSEKLIALARLSGGVAHEIGNPLTSISSYVQILKGMEFDDFTRDALETILRQVKRIDSIIKRMSDFSKDRTGELEHHDVEEVVRNTLDLIRYDRRSRKMRIEVDVPAGLPKVYVDANQLIQVFVNLSMNAADAMAEGGVLRIRGLRLNGSVEVSFEDTGPGIPPEHLDRVFDPFFTTKESGTGLGLAVSYGIIRSFGGDIVAENSSGTGTTFRVRLPIHD